MNYLSKESLKELKLFTNIRSESLEVLTQKGQLKCYVAGDSIFRDQEALTYFYIILSGTATLYKLNANGQHKVIFILGAGELLNEAIVEDLPSSINCTAYSNCQVLMIYKEDLLALMEKDFILTQNIMNSLSKRIRRLYRQLKNSTSITKIEKKLAAKLWKLGKDYGIPCEEGILINFPITVTALADLLGSYRETVSRALKILIEKDLIIYKHKHIIIPDANQLSNFFKSS